MQLLYNLKMYVWVYCDIILKCNFVAASTVVEEGDGFYLFVWCAVSFFLRQSWNLFLHLLKSLTTCFKRLDLGQTFNVKKINALFLFSFQFFLFRLLIKSQKESIKSALTNNSNCLSFIGSVQQITNLWVVPVCGGFPIVSYLI